MAAADKVVVRAATREDMPTIHRLIHELATYEGAPDGPKLSAQDSGTGRHSPDRLACAGGQPAGERLLRASGRARHAPLRGPRGAATRPPAYRARRGGCGPAGLYRADKHLTYDIMVDIHTTRNRYDQTVQSERYR